MKILQWLDKISFPFLLIICVTLGLAPFAPEPHVWQKLKMLFDGSLHKPIDIFDLFLHGTPWVLLLLKTARLVLKSNRAPSP